MAQTRHADNEISIALEEIQRKGSSNFVGPGGVTITHNLNWSAYAAVVVQADANPLGSVGEVWVTDVAANSFVVRNSGSARTSFTYIINRT